MTFQNCCRATYIYLSSILGIIEPPASGDSGFILKEDGDYILQETGFKIKL